MVIIVKLVFFFNQIDCSYLKRLNQFNRLL